ncbi:MAG: ribosome-associated translation inhibitor RaiA [Pseudomonadota bacterium]
MQINLTGHHVDITSALRNYVHEKFERLERHFTHVIDAHVILTVEKLRHKAEASMLVSGNRLFADAVEEDMYAAIDGLVDKLDRQVVKHKEKLKDHRRAEGSHRNFT